MGVAKLITKRDVCIIKNIMGREVKVYYYKVNLPEKLSEISEDNFCEVFGDLTDKYDGMWLKVMQTEYWGNYNNQFIVYDSNRPIEIEYNDWKLKPIEIGGKLAYQFYTDWNYTRFGAIIEDTEGNIKNLKEDFWFWEVAHRNVKTPQSQIACFFRMFAEMVETSHDVVYYDLYINSFKGRSNLLASCLSKYTFKIGLKTGRDKINWIEKQCSRCKTLDKKYIEDNVCPEIPISTILQRYEDALKEARKLYYWIK